MLNRVGQKLLNHLPGSVLIPALGDVTDDAIRINYIIQRDVTILPIDRPDRTVILQIKAGILPGILLDDLPVVAKIDGQGLKAVRPVINLEKMEAR